FTGRIEFYAMAYKAVFFLPEDNKKQLRSFWKEELRKLHNFRKNNERFIAYYESEDTSLDEEYFLEAKGASVSTPYQVGTELSSSHDYLVSAIHAQELYHKYVMDQLEKLRKE
ncbi:MAG TPA: RteC domain-containing protein, partial [Chitinophagaceae bacterium]|nr:RteC domain-containing protein [Chitinophagaceae bacterium]